MGAAARIRNISSTGRRNRFYGSVILFSCAIVVNFVYLIVGEPPMLTPNYNPTILLLTVVILSGFYTAGCLVLLESTTQVCVYHGFLGTHDSSSGSKNHAEALVSQACRRKSWSIVLRSLLYGIILTIISLWILSLLMVN